MPKTSAACGTVIKTGTSSKLLYIFITYFLKKRRHLSASSYCSCLIISSHISFSVFLQKGYPKISNNIIKTNSKKEITSSKRSLILSII